MIPIMHYQVYFSEEREKAAAELEKNVDRTIKCVFRTSSPQDRIGKFMTKSSAGFLSNFPADPPPSSLLTPKELQTYIQHFKESGFRGGLHWYGCWELNWRDEAELNQNIQQPALIITAGNDPVITPSMTRDMEQWVPLLERNHVEEGSHWVHMEYPKEVNRIILKWLQSLNLHTKVSSFMTKPSRSRL